MNEPREIWRSTLLLQVGHFLSDGSVIRCIASNTPHLGHLYS
jgi:hypothetical protein